jgi:3,2-trans-enoyl-CoA isomerase
MLETIVHGEIHELRLNRPPANALTLELVEALRGAVEKAPDGGAGAVVISGQQGMFSAGHDVPLLLAKGRDEVREFWMAFFDVPLPGGRHGHLHLLRRARHGRGQVPHRA